MAGYVSRIAYGREKMNGDYAIHVHGDLQCRNTGTAATCARQVKPSDHQQRGIALVMVLWLLVLMTVIASSHSRNVRTETRLAFNHIELGKARNLAEAGIYHAIMELLVTEDRERWPVDGSVNHIRFDGGDAAISVRDTRGLIDINSVRGAVLDNLFVAAGIEDEQQRQQLVDATLDWRDSDSLKHLHGAEDSDYRNAGLKWAARDGYFTSVEEFRYVLGMTNPIFELLSPYLTVYSGQPGVTLEYAPQWLADALGNKPLDSPPAETAETEEFDFGIELESEHIPTYRITAQATTKGGTTASVAAVVEISSQGKHPYKILSWRTPARSLEPPVKRA